MTQVGTRSLPVEHAADDGLRLEGLCFRYSRRCAVLREVNLYVGPGQVHCVLGPSGCGKTTLLRLIAGLERVECGSISINGREVAGSGVHTVPERRGVGIVFQDLALFPTMSVGRNVEFGMRGVRRRDRRERAAALLERVGLPGYSKRMPHTLSGGQQQRVALARSLAAEPKVMLLDEPFSSLDTDLRKQLRGELLGVLRASGVATLMVTHDRDEAREVADGISGLCCDGAGCSRLETQSPVQMGISAARLAHAATGPAER